MLGKILGFSPWEKSTFMTRKLLPIALIVALSPWFAVQSLHAQRMGGHMGFGRPAGSFQAGGFGPRNEFAGRRGYPYGVYSDLLYDGLLDAGYPVASQPPVIILQSPATPQPAASPVSAPMQPLMIELQGNRYVRISGDNDSQSQMIDSDVSPASPAGSRIIARNEPPAALLVFRDGHQEQVRNYTIADGNLYASSNTDAGLPTTHKIQLSSLDLPATIRSNQDRGVQFHLPTAANVVIVGP